VSQLAEASWQISRFHDVTEDWFRYKSRTFDVKIYDRFKGYMPSGTGNPAWWSLTITLKLMGAALKTVRGMEIY
jgi:hypothetical protein